MDNARDIWKDLKLQDSQEDLLRISELQQDMASIRLGDQTITDYFTRLRVIWDRPDPVCSYESKCVFDALTSVMERKQQDHVM